ncbi:MAG TPA: DUF5615 family PIN-like protein [Longimicrobium sp.]|jgi:hypothetical protein|uniref:DUF5615 family PIN-like protein n=1 Tax=Longimicrobium sp. TaxID=2029185 RepID=UPI002ED77E7B
MAGRAGQQLVFLFDENMPARLAHALRGLGERCVHVGDPGIGLNNTPDEAVLAYAGERGWIYVGRDHRILHRPHERAVLKQWEMGAFFLNQSLNKSLCSITTALFRNWPEMKRVAASQPRPSLYLIRETSVRALPRRRLGNEDEHGRRQQG